MLRSLLIPLLILLIAPSENAAQSAWNDRMPVSAPRERLFDLVHVSITLRIDVDNARVSGQVLHRIVHLRDSLATIRLDADRAMSIGRVTVDGAETYAELDSSSLTIALPTKSRRGDTIDMVVPWSVTPASGLYFKGEGTPHSPRQVWTQGEPEEHHRWVPLWDRPDDLTTTETHITAPVGWKALSNGQLTGRRLNDDGTSTWSWLQDLPHATYLITVVAGDFHIARDTVDGIPLEYWVPPADSMNVSTTFGRTPEILRFIADYVGVPYPWAKYAQVVVDDFMHGGMENTSATTLHGGVIVAPGRLDYTPDGIIGHEIVHQWFGDLVTNRSWIDLWLHESFAEYLELRALERLYGHDRFIAEFHERLRSGIAFDHTPQRSSLVGRIHATANIYYRGATILHMLNGIIGDTAFRNGCRLFLERHRHTNVDTEDLRRAFEEASGRSLLSFFRQWIYGAGHPFFLVEKEMGGDTLLMTVTQTQARDSLTSLFELDIPIHISCVDGSTVDTLIGITTSPQRFAIPLRSPVRYAIFDSGGETVKEVDYPRSTTELLAQLQAPRAIDRYEGAAALRRIDPALVGWGSAIETYGHELLACFEREESYVVRSELLGAIARTSIDSLVIDAVGKGIADTSRDVRRVAIDIVAGMSDSSNRSRLLRSLLADRSDLIAAEALSLLARSDTSGLLPTFQRLRGVRGRGGRVADAWLAAAAGGRFVELADQVALYTDPVFGSDTRSFAFDVLGTLGRATPAVVAAIEDGLGRHTVIIRASAAICALKLMGTEVRSMLMSLRDRVDGDRLQTVQSLLSPEP